MKFQSDLKFGQIYEKKFIKIMGLKVMKTKQPKLSKNMILLSNKMVRYR